MSLPLPVWLLVQEQLLGDAAEDCGSSGCFEGYDDDALYRMFHLSRACIAFVADSLRPRMSGAELPPDAMLMVALSYLAHGACSAAVLERVGIGERTECAAAIVAAVCGALVDARHTFMSFPATQEAKARVAAEMERRSGIPRVIGVVAPAHFRIRAPYDKTSFRSFLNGRGYTSVVSQLICDADGNILSVEPCCVGGALEQDMWERSLIGQEMERGGHAPYWLIGGSGYRLSPHLLTPVTPAVTPVGVSGGVSEAERRMGVAHAQLCEVMREALGSLKRRFRCLLQLGFAQEASLQQKDDIIAACCVLHNLAKKFSVAPPPAAGRAESPHLSRRFHDPLEPLPEALLLRQQLIQERFSQEGTP